MLKLFRYMYRMPKRSTHPHVLERIRKILGKSREQFAVLVGVSTETIKKAEQGPRNLAEEVAMRILSTTGVHPDELQKGKGGQALNALGEPYTLEWFQRVWLPFWSPREGDETIPADVSAGSISNLKSLCQKLNSARPQDRFSQYLQSRFSPRFRQRLANYRGADDDALKQELAGELTRLIGEEDLYDKIRFTGIVLSEKTSLMVRKNPSGSDLVRLNRLLLEDAYPEEIRRHRSVRDEACDHAVAISNLARFILLAATRGKRPILTTVFRDMVQKLDHIRHAYGLDAGFWAEYDDACSEECRSEEAMVKLPGDKEGAKQLNLTDTADPVGKTSIPVFWLTGQLALQHMHFAQLTAEQKGGIDQPASSAPKKEGIP